MIAAFALTGCQRKPVAETPEPPATQPPAEPASTQAQPTPEPPKSAEPASAEAQPTPEPPKSPEPPEDPLATRIGLLVPLTGSHASFGIDAVNGAKLAVDEINLQGGVLGHPLNLVVKDTESQSERIGAVIGELIDSDKVAALLGEITTDCTLVAAPIAQEREIPMITPGATNEKVTAAGNYVFRVCYTDAFQVGVMAKFADSLEVEKAAILFDESSSYGSGLRDAFKADFVRHGGSIVAEESYRAGDVDFSAQLNAIKLKNPDSIFLPGYYTDVALIIKQARQLGIEAPFLGTDGWDSAELLKIAGPAVNNSYFVCHFSSEHLSDRAKPFNEAYRAKFESAPPPLAALTYDSVWLVADALKRAGSAEPAALRDALAGTKDFSGVTGTITMDQERNPKKPAIVIRVQDGKFTYLETAEP
jgi:branched-chain amino acid transport system substrate-binding protein